MKKCKNCVEKWQFKNTCEPSKLCYVETFNRLKNRLLYAFELKKEELIDEVNEKSHGNHNFTKRFWKDICNLKVE